MGLPLGEESDQSPKFTKTILPVHRCACPLFFVPSIGFRGEIGAPIVRDMQANATR